MLGYEGKEWQNEQIKSLQGSPEQGFSNGTIISEAELFVMEKEVLSIQISIHTESRIQSENHITDYIYGQIPPASATSSLSR
jgi:hypothetical protein